ncbi:hypothetical protein GOP47_0007874 [Adiantum capillus-veneris]|uniref:SHSP domain-containing protein n=1 Tax=Adiantum capillus-veneris TaxID=13818 RepID=A0A9D4V246_ADICA|nr:hypothetical protein GOP47_0007225 [Adiantum capillus-veneris]KAI5078050.1 hypothetical protein GOP47_0007874 [Adiantum capillus-veneris]
MEFVIGRDPLLHFIQQHLSREDDEVNGNSTTVSDPSPARAYLRERNAMASTAVDVKEYPNSYVFIADMPGLKSSDIKVSVESGNVLLLSGERKKEEEPADVKVKYLSMERRTLKFMRKFTLPSDANVENISAACQDGVLTVTVPKIPPPAPRVISVNVK